MKTMRSKDPLEERWYFFGWCDENGLNDGSPNDGGELQGATIADYELIEDGVTIEAHNKNAVTIEGILYDADTVVAYKLGGGELGVTGEVRCVMTPTNGEVLVETNIHPIEKH